MENYIRDFVDKLLYDVACILIDEIADQVMAEDDADEEDGSRLELLGIRIPYTQRNYAVGPVKAPGIYRV